MITARRAYLYELPYNAERPFSGPRSGATSCVYVMGSAEEPSRVKIGRTSCLAARLDSARTWVPEIEVFFEHHGDGDFAKSVEKMLHDSLAELRVHPRLEWFDFGGCLDELDELKRGGLPASVMVEVIAQRDPSSRYLPLRRAEARKKLAFAFDPLLETALAKAKHDLLLSA